MKITEYICDICGDVVLSNRPGYRPKTFVSFVFGPASGGPARRSEMKSIDDSDRFLCMECVAGVVSIAEQADPRKDMTGGT
jgi:hypothetical protein